MLSYLSAETGFIRAFGNRSLILIFLCALARTSTEQDKLSALGLSIDLTPGIIVVYGPFLALLLLISLNLESDGLYLMRGVVLEEATQLASISTKPSVWIYLLFSVPTLAAAFLVYQFIVTLVPEASGCHIWTWRQHFTDFTFQGGTPSMYCIRDVTKDMPWIYPPLQTYLFLVNVGACIYLTWHIAKKWPQLRVRR